MSIEPTNRFMSRLILLALNPSKNPEIVYKRGVLDFMDDQQISASLLFLELKYLLTILGNVSLERFSRFSLFVGMRLLADPTLGVISLSSSFE